jgi:Xaa-Pro aminopeptidase
MTATSDAVFERRLERCRDALDDTDAVVCFPGPNLRYLTGFSESPSERHLLLFVAKAGVAFVAPELYVEQLRAETPVETIHGWTDGEDPLEAVRDVAAALDVTGGQLLVDDTLWARFTLGLRAALPDATFGLASAVLDDLRIRKDETELDRLFEAAKRSDAVSEVIRAMGAEVIGWSEAELAAESGHASTRPVPRARRSSPWPRRVRTPPDHTTGTATGSSRPAIPSSSTSAPGWMATPGTRPARPSSPASRPTRSSTPIRSS